MEDQHQVHHFSGSHYDMGFQQGERFKQSLIEAFKAFKDYPDISKMRPKLIPQGLFFLLAARKSRKWFQPTLEKLAPNQAERIRGISDGSGISQNLIYLLCSTELLLTKKTYDTPIIDACTSISYSKTKTKRDHSMVSRNFDYRYMVVPHLRIRKNSPNKGLQNFDITASPLPGTFNGINEKGVFIGTDEVSAIKEVDPNNALPASILIQEALEQATSSQDVFDYFKQHNRGSSNSVMVNDPSGDMFVMEYTSKRIIKRLPTENHIHATNHFISDELKEVNMPSNALYTKDAGPLAGMKIQESTHKRYQIADLLLGSWEKYSIEEMKSLHSDHSVTSMDIPDRNCLCRHGPIMTTASSHIFDLETMEAWICFGSPCKNEYVHHQITF
ncbi:MAG: C45 family autoproteolytic acyltransferase/hydrolase [Promethearchaeota archaeon]